MQNSRHWLAKTGRVLAQENVFAEMGLWPAKGGQTQQKMNAPEGLGGWRFSFLGLDGLWVLENKIG